MLMNKDPKKMAALIVMKTKESPEGESMASHEKMPQMDEGLVSAAEEAMAAIEKKDAGAFADALKSFMEMCSDDYKPSGEVEEKP